MREDFAALDWGMMLASICKSRYAGSSKPLLYHMNKLLDQLLNPLARTEEEQKQAKKPKAGGGAKARTRVVSESATEDGGGDAEVSAPPKDE